MDQMGLSPGRLRLLRQSKGLSIRALAELTDKAVSYSYISAIEKGKHPRVSSLVARHLASALGVPVEVLTGEVDLPRRRSTQEIIHELEEHTSIDVDVVELRAAAGYLSGAPAQETASHTPTPEQRRHKLFGIRVSGDCMEPRLHDGYIAIIDTDVEPHAGDVVLAMHEGEPILKEYRPVNSHIELVPSKKKYKTVRANETTQIVGVVVDAHLGRKP